FNGGELFKAETGNIVEPDLLRCLPEEVAYGVAENAAQNAGDGADGGEPERLAPVAQGQGHEQHVRGDGEEAALGEAQEGQGTCGVSAVGKPDDPVVEPAVQGPCGDGGAGGLGFALVRHRSRSGGGA